MPTLNPKSNESDQTAKLVGLVLEVVQTLQGGFMLFGSLAIALSVFLQPAMRRQKHLVVVAALGLADAVNGYAYLASGLFRFVLYVQEAAHNNDTTTDQCWVNNPFRLAWGWADLATTFMLLAVSCDRLLSVAYPVWYMCQSTSFSYCFLVGPAYLIGAFDLLIAVYLAKQTPQTHEYVDRVCYLAMSYCPWQYTIHLNLMTGAAAMSVIVYAALLIVYINKKFVRRGLHDSIVHERSAIYRSQQHTQRRLTKTLAVSAMCTLSFYVLPLQVDRILMDFNFYEDCLMCSKAAMCFYIVANCNCLMNVVLFFTRHGELRKAFKYTLRFKKMPLNNKCWM